MIETPKHTQRERGVMNRRVLVGATLGGIRRGAALMLLGAVEWSAPVFAEDSPPPSEPVLDRIFPSLKEAVPTLPPFLRDTELSLQLRTYYLDDRKPSGTLSEAWAGGGWLSYRSGWLLDTVGIGATVYGSAPLYAPADIVHHLICRKLRA